MPYQAHTKYPGIHALVRDEIGRALRGLATGGSTPAGLGVTAGAALALASGPGTAGSNGGATLWVETHDPAVLHSDGDLRLDPASNEVYYQVEEAWTFLGVLPVALGLWRFGATAPAEELGDDGDNYLDTATGAIYHRADEAWTLEYTPAGLVAGEVDVDHLAPGTVPLELDPRSFVRDGNFEILQQGELAWWVQGYGPATIAQLTGDGAAGNCCLAFSARTTAGDAGIFARLHTLADASYEARTPILDTDTLYCAMSAKRLGAADGNGVKLVINCWTAAMAQLADLVPVSITPGTSWARQGALVGAGTTLAWPSGTRYIRVEVRDSSTGTGAVNRVGAVVVRNETSTHAHNDADGTSKLAQANSHQSIDTDSAQSSDHHTVDGATTPTALDGTGAAGSSKKASAADHKHAVTASSVSLGNVTNDAQVKAAIGTTKGDLITFSAAATPVRQAAGATAGWLHTDGSGNWAISTPGGNSPLYAQDFPLPDARVGGGDITAGATLDAAEREWRLLFSNAVARQAAWSGRAQGYAAGSLRVIIEWKCSVNTGNVGWLAAFMAYDPASSGQAVNANSFAAARTATDAVPATAGYSRTSVITFTAAQADALAAGYRFRLRIGRDVTVGGNAAANAEVVGFSIVEVAA